MPEGNQMNDTISEPAHVVALCAICGTSATVPVGTLYAKCPACIEDSRQCSLQSAMPVQAGELEMATFDRDHEGDRFDGLG